MKFIKYIFYCIVLGLNSDSGHGFTGSNKDLIVSIVASCFFILLFTGLYLICKKHFSKWLTPIMAIILTIAITAIIALVAIIVESIFNL